MNQDRFYEIISQYDFPGELISYHNHGNGHINDTYLLDYRYNDHTQRYILQRINTDIFQNPSELMDNIIHVTEFLKKKIIENDGDPDRETLTVIPTCDGHSYYKDSKGDCWRIYPFITNATSYDEVQCDDDFYQSAISFGRFQNLLADFPAQSLYETIPEFHNTEKRFATFKEVVQNDCCHRAKDVQQEIDFVLQHESTAQILNQLQDQGKLPLRVTHNDTKLNNILIDNDTHKGICVIDLDTVMPGLAINDFGDSIRFGASTGAEDEKDVSKIECDMHLFELYTKGFIQGCGGKLTQEEIKALPLGAKVMTFECGMRFLTDYLQGDTYFKTDYPTHNLVRCRTQFKLVADMEQKWQTMNAIVEKYNQ